MGRFPRDGMGDRVGPYLGLLALAGGSLFSFSRLFSGTEWVGPVFGAMLTAITLGVLLDRIGLAGMMRTAISGAACMWFIALFVVPDTTKYGLPDIGKLLQLAGDALETARESTALLPPEPKFHLVASAAAWIGILVSNQIALAHRPILSLLPWLGVFAVSSATGAPAGRLASFLAFVSGLTIALFTIRRSLIEPIAGAENAEAGGELRNAWGAAVLAGIALSAGALWPQVVPGYRSLGWFADRFRGPASQTVVSPLVQIRPQLLDQGRRKLFEVRTAVPQGRLVYWRMVALDNFDGNAWGTSAEYERVKKEIEYSATEKFLGRAFSLPQRYRITDLGGPWIPAAYQADEASGTEVSADPSSSSLIARRRISPGVAYQITSKVPAPTAEDLRAAPPAAIDRYTKLEGVSDPVREIAATWTKDKATAYDKVVAISDRLRRFRYNESVTLGHSADQLLQFLTRIRAGYCEQFAASMAVLARSLGIPARVAVGFLPGDFDSGLGGYVVRTNHAHAWPEIYFSGVGWVAFEPTPRGGLAQPAYTAGPAPDEEIDERVEEAEAQTAPPPPPPAEAPSPQEADQPPQEKKETSPLLLVPIVAAAFLAGLATVAIGKRARIAARYRRANSPAERVRAAFFHFEDRAIDLDRGRRPDQTPAEYIEEIRAALRLDSAASAILLGTFERAAFATEMPTTEDAAAAFRAAAQLTTQLWDRSGWFGRIGLLVSPRSVLAR